MIMNKMYNIHIIVYGKRVVWLGDILWKVERKTLAIEISLHQAFWQLTATFVSGITDESSNQLPKCLM